MCVGAGGSLRVWLCGSLCCCLIGSDGYVYGCVAVCVAVSLSVMAMCMAVWQSVLLSLCQ